MKALIIVGAGSLGREIAWLVERVNAAVPTWELLGFLDDNPALRGQSISGYPVLGTAANAIDYPDAYFVCAIAAAKIRKQVIERLGDVHFATLIDPTVIISDKVTIGEGTIICAGAILTVDITLGKHVIIDVACTVGHNAHLRDYVTAYPSVNISGTTDIGECVELGTGTQVIQLLRIGAHTIVGAGAVVVRDLPPNCTAVGCPAKPIKFSEP